MRTNVIEAPEMIRVEPRVLKVLDKILNDAGYEVVELRGLQNHLGIKRRLRGGQVVTAYDTGTICVQGRGDRAGVLRAIEAHVVANQRPPLPRVIED